MTGAPETVDVQELMREVQERARTLRSGRDPGPAVSGDVDDLHANASLLTVPLRSPRPGLGRIVSAIKLALARLLAPIFHRQTAFNETAAYLMAREVARTSHLWSEAARLSGDTARLGTDTARLGTDTARLDTDATRLGHLTHRLEADAVRLEVETKRVADQAHRTEAMLEEQIKRQLIDLSGRLVRLERRLREAESAPATPLAAVGETATVSPASGATGFDYFAIHDRFRGPEHEIKARHAAYLEHFADAAPVLDVGCGRGEFLELLRERGVTARGVDTDRDAVLHGRDKGLDVVQADAFRYLEELADGSLGGVFCAQVIEHLPPPRALRLVDLCVRKLRRGGVVLFETPNPACLTVFAQAFFLDLTHVWPYHPDLMKATLELAGFADVRTIFSSPIDPAAALPVLGQTSVFGQDTEAYNRAAVLVNRLLLGCQDYAVMGWRRSDTS